MEIHNLSQMKKALQKEARFEILKHCRPECVGQIREVNIANTVGFYTYLADNKDAEMNKSNGGKGIFMVWGKASSWEFDGDVCSYFKADSPRESTAPFLVFRVMQ